MITNHFVTVGARRRQYTGARRVHYTRAGHGPPVAMIHESPCSAKSLATAQTVLAERFTALAFDTPGYGLSDPLPLQTPEITDFADALAETLTALGINQAAIYGRHTGASIALEFGRRHPARCAMVIPDGLPIYAGPQLESRLNDYLKPLQPSWDGAHLVWLWFRYRDQHSFWPWHAQDGTHRAGRDVPDLDVLHRGVVEFLEAGDGYRVAYAAAFRHGGKALHALAETTVPVCCVAREGDSLFRTLTQFPPGTWIQPLARDEIAATRQTLDLLTRHPGDPTTPPAPPSQPIPGRTTPTYVDKLLVRRVNHDQQGIPLLLLHDANSSSAELDPLLLALRCPALAIDLPGHGESPAATPDVGIWATAVIQALDQLGLHQVRIYAHGAGAATAVELAHQAPNRVTALTLGSPPLLPPRLREAFAAAYAPNATPTWDAGHLLRVWHHLRDQELWSPWHERTQATARPGEPDITPTSLNRRTRNALKHATLYQDNWHAALAYPLQERLAELPPARIIAAPRDLFATYNAHAQLIEDGWTARAAALG